MLMVMIMMQMTLLLCCCCCCFDTVVIRGLPMKMEDGPGEKSL
jgi:hypothetical protein